MTDSSEQDSPTIDLAGKTFEIVKDDRLREGMVLRHGDTYARLGSKEFVLEEQDHTESLYRRGFPVPKVLESQDLQDGQRFFTESSMGSVPFHKLFADEYRQQGHVTARTFEQYLQIMTRYLQAQVSEANRTQISAEAFIEALLPGTSVTQSYAYFEHDIDRYLAAIEKAGERLSSAAMGILQFDLNPYNILEKGVIDFELVGYGPIGYDVLMSARWGGTWFTNYPSRYPAGYVLNEQQIGQNDKLVQEMAVKNNIGGPTVYMQEFLLLKSAWALSAFKHPQPDWPQDKIAFRRFRANVLQNNIDDYLDGRMIDYTSFSSTPGGELID